jgi:hypothetical protein
MGLCLFLVPNRAPVALSVQPAGPSEYVDDGTTLPEEDTFAYLAKDNPPAFLEACLRRYNREIHGYSGELRKQERLEGKVQSPEVVDFWFSEKPYSVLLKWREGIRLVRGSMYVEAENNEKVLVKPKILNILIDQEPDCPLARRSSRYTMKEFSIRQGTERTLHAWAAAADKCALQVEYKGVQPISELNGRKCHVLVRTCDPPEEEGVVTVEVLIDAENWLQLGSTLKDGSGTLIGKYFFPVLNVNPQFPAETFTKANLKK